MRKPTDHDGTLTAAQRGGRKYKCFPSDRIGQPSEDPRLAGAGREVTNVLQPDLDILGATQNVKEPMAFMVDSSGLLARVRFEKRV